MATERPGWKCDGCGKQGVGTCPDRCPHCGGITLSAMVLAPQPRPERAELVERLRQAAEAVCDAFVIYSATPEMRWLREAARALSAAEARAERYRVALEACEQNLRLIHEAAGPVPRGAPMPSHSTFGAWELARRALSEEEHDG